MTRSHLYRVINSASLALPGAYCNQYVAVGVIFLDENDEFVLTAPAIINHWYDAWCVINSTLPLYYHVTEYETYADYEADNVLRDLGGSFGLGKVDIKWSTGLRTVPGRAYAMRFNLTDALLAPFTMFLGVAGIVDELSGT